MKRLPSAAPALAFTALLVLLAVFLAPKAIGKMPDFEVYWTAAARARDAEPLYRVEDGHYQFKYLPAFAILATPVAAVSLKTAKALWFGTSVALLVSLIALAIAVLPDRLKPRWLLVVALVVSMAKFYAHELVLGQVNLLFVVIVLFGVLSLRRGREAPAGALLALAVVIKPYAVLFAPWLLARRHVASIAAFALALVAVLALPAVVYGLDGAIDQHAAWWRTVTESTAPNLTNADNVSLAGMFSKWLGESGAVRPVVGATSAILLAAAVAVFLWRERAKMPEAAEAALLLTLIPLLSPQGWDYVFLIATPAIALLANYERQLPRVVRVLTIAAVLTIGLSLYDVMGREAYAAFMGMSVITLCFLVVVAALCTLRLRGIA